MTAVVGAVMAAKNMRMVALSNALPMVMLWALARLSMGSPHNLDWDLRGRGPSGPSAKLSILQQTRSREVDQLARK